VLEQFGEVAMFRSFKYHPSTPVPNAFLTLFNTASAATEALNQSPIRYRLMPVSSEPEASAPEPLGSTVAQPTTSYPNPQDEKIFELHFSSTTFDHDTYLDSPSTNPLHGPFRPVSPTKSYIASSLDDVIAPSLWAPGLKDWETDGFRLTDTQTPNPEVQPGQGKMRTSVEWRVAQRERKRREMAVPVVMKGLRPLRQAYERAREKPILNDV